MHGYIQNIQQASLANTDFRQVLYTGKYSQLALMSLKPAEELGFEVHMQDQFFSVEKGMGHVIINGVTTEIQAGSGILVPAGANHNVINTGSVDLKLYTLYSPPSHLDGAVSHVRSRTEGSHPPFDGITTE